MRALGRFLLGLLAVVGLLTIGIVGLLWWGVASLDLPRTMTDAKRPDSFVLTVDLRRPFPEGEAAGFGGFGGGGGATLAATVRAIDHAAGDPAVTALLAEVGGTGAGLAQAQELRAAVARFRAAGKPAWVFGETLNEGGDVLDTYLAAAFDQVIMQPSGGVGPLGFASEVPFLRGLLENIGVQPQVDAREDHKNAFDSVTRRSMSDAQRESLTALLGGFWDQVRGDIATDRGLTPDAVEKAAVASPLLPGEAVEAGLVDRLAYRDETENALFADRGTRETVSLEDYSRGLPDPTAGNRPQVALIHATGQVLRGEAEDSVFGGETAIHSDTMARAIRDAADDTATRALIIRIDSPGGSYVASDTIWREIRRVRENGLPVIVSMGNVAASGGYFIAMAGDHIVAERGTVTGSIGVISGKFVLQDMWQKLDVQWDAVSAGGPATMFSPHQSFTWEEWQKFQRHLDWIYDDFVTKVADSRGMTKEQVLKVAGGRIWTGVAAAEAGLVDELGGLDAALAEAKRRANIATDQPVSLVPFPRPRSTLEQLMALFESGPLIGSDARALAQLARIVGVLEPVAARLQAAEGAAGHGGSLSTPLPAYTGDGR
ncbi:signal peptide peptidase SppA [Caenispirillum bisanense]|uniref:signal peptide peptidase SppA n=1 Tax=Caenispirillum bisanense TaxID=414052 RepID=UPI0031D1E509